VVDWYYIFSILELGVYPPPKAIYNVHKFIRFYFPGETFCVLKEKEEKWYDDSAEQLCKRKSNRMILGALRRIGYRCKLKYQSIQIFVIMIL
jgi:hypothetical protein